MKRVIIVIIVIFIIGFLGFLIVNRKHISTTSSSTIQIVAAENYYGDIAKQIGGNKVQVFSILSDPNADPHEYESSVQDATAVSRANIVIKNGDGYDTWMNKLLSASPNSKRIVLTGYTLAKYKLPDNPHVWYGIDNMKTIASAITDALKKEDPAGSALFTNNLATFDSSLQIVQQKMDEIKSRYNGTPVALTETIFLYQAQPMGLRILTPLSFERAIAEGNDPSANDVATANDQITKKQVKVLIYNAQTVTPITTNLQNKAMQQNISIVPVTETMPTGKHYQSWMLDQLTALQKALQRSK